MKATITLDGNIVLTPESETEQYALRQFAQQNGRMPAPSEAFYRLRLSAAARIKIRVMLLGGEQ